MNCNREHSLESPRNVALLNQAGWRGPDDMQIALDSLRRRARGWAINICQYYNMGNCTAARCWRLHTCYRHVLDSCPLDDCSLSHDVRGGWHNMDILEAAGLTDTALPELLSRLRENLWYFHPQYCNYYGRQESDCDRQLRHCLRIHCCVAFLRGRCRAGDSCSKNHSMADAHNQRVLRFFDWTEQYVLSVLTGNNHSRRPGVEN